MVEGFREWEGEIGHAVRCERVTDDVDAWRAGRSTYVGASEASAVLGVHPRKGPWAVWNAKINGEPSLDNLAIRRGRRREPLILQDAADLLGVPVFRAPWVLRHPDVHPLACNLDGLVEVDGALCVVEAKWSGMHQAKSWRILQEEGRPLAGSWVEMNWIQVQTQLAVTGLAAGYLVAECDLDCFLIRVARCEDTIRSILDAVATFWTAHVEARLEPPASGGDLQPLTDAHPHGEDGLEVELGRDVAHAVKFYREAQQAERLAKATKDHHKARIVQALGDATAGILPDGDRITWSNRSRKGTDWKALQADHPDIVKDYATTSTWRSIRV